MRGSVTVDVADQSNMLSQGEDDDSEEAETIKTPMSKSFLHDENMKFDNKEMLDLSVITRVTTIFSSWPIPEMQILFCATHHWPPVYQSLIVANS